MAKLIKKSIIADKGLFDDPKQEAKDFAQVLIELQEEFKKVGIESKKAFKGLDFTKTANIDKLDKEIKKLTGDVKALDAVRKSAKKTQDQANKTRKKAIDLTDEELKQKIKEQKANRARRKQLEIEILLEQDSIKNKEDLTNRIKVLTAQAQKLDLGSEELKKTNAELNELRELQKQNSDQFTVDKINIGNYRSALDGLTDSMDDQQKRLAILIKTYKDYEESTDKNSRQARRLRKEIRSQKKEIKRLDDASKGYVNTNKKVLTGIKALGAGLKSLGIGFLLGFLSTLGEAFGSSREGANALSKEMAKFTQTMKVFLNSLIDAWDGITDVFTAAVDGVLKYSAHLEILSAKKDLFFAKSGKGFANLIGNGDKAAENIKKIEARIELLNKRIQDGEDAPERFSKGIAKIQKAFEGNVDTTKNAIKAQEEYKQLQLDTEIAILQQERALAGLAERRQTLQDMSDDDTIGFETRKKLLIEARKLNKEFVEEETALAMLQEKLAIQRVKAELSASTVLSKAQLDEIHTAEQLTEVLKNKAVAIKISQDADEQFTEARQNALDKQAEQEAFLRDQGEKNRKTLRDNFEQQLDITEEFTENQIDSNAKILEDTSKTQAERAKAFVDNQNAVDDLFERSIKLIQDQAKSSIDLREDLSDAQKAEAKAKIDNIALDKIIASNNAEEIQVLINKADLGEIEEKRLKESVKLNKELTGELKEQKKTLEASTDNVADLELEIQAQRDALSKSDLKAIEELENERRKLRKQSLRDRIALETEGTEKRLELEKELNDLLLDEQEKVLKKQEDKEKESFKRRKKIIEAAANFVEAILSKQIEENLKRIDEQIRKNEEQENKALNSIENVGAANELQQASLSELDRREAELRREKERQLKTQQQLEVGLAVFKTYNSKLDQGDKNALGSTFLESTALAEFAATLVSAKEGLDDTGVNPTKGVDGIGGRFAVIHDKEKILNKEDSDPFFKMGMKNKDIGDIGRSMLKGDLFNIADLFSGGNEVVKQQQVIDRTPILINEIKGLRRELIAIKNKPYTGPRYDEWNQMIIDTIQLTDNVKETKSNHIKHA